MRLLDCGGMLKATGRGLTNPRNETKISRALGYTHICTERKEILPMPRIGTRGRQSPQPGIRFRKSGMRLNGRDSTVRDLDAYLFGVFHHRFNRALRKERKRAEFIRNVASSRDLETLTQAHDSKTVRDVERSIQVNEAIQRMDDWTRRV